MEKRFKVMVDEFVWESFDDFEKAKQELHDQRKRFKIERRQKLLDADEIKESIDSMRLEF